MPRSSAAAGPAAPRRAAGRRTGRRRRWRRSSSRAAGPGPTTTAATAVPTNDPIPPMTTTMNAKISRDAPWPGTRCRRKWVEDPGQSRGGAAHREDHREGALHVDAQRLHHRPVLHSGADDQAEPGEAQAAPGVRATDDDGDADVEEPVVGKLGAGDLGGPGQPRRLVDGVGVGAPDALHRSRPRQRQAHGHEHLLDVTAVERPDENHLDDQPDDRAHGHGDQDREEELTPAGTEPGSAPMVSQPAYAPASMKAPWAKLRTPIRP